MTRFKMATLEIYNLNEIVAMLALKKGLRISWFTYFLDKKPPKIYSELLIRAQKYIHADEADRTRRELDGRLLKKQAQEGPNEPREQRLVANHWEGSKPKDIPAKDKKYIPLVPRTKILMEIEDKRYLHRPPPLKPSGDRDKSKYYQFHRDHNHDIECRHLKKGDQRADLAWLSQGVC